LPHRNACSTPPPDCAQQNLAANPYLVV
jgi:hypothetical protein